MGLCGISCGVSECDIEVVWRYFYTGMAFDFDGFVIFVRVKVPFFFGAIPDMSFSTIRPNQCS